LVRVRDVHDVILAVALISQSLLVAHNIVFIYRYDRQEKEKKTKPAVVQLYEVITNKIIIY